MKCFFLKSGIIFIFLVITTSCATAPKDVPEPGTPSYKEAAESAFDSAMTAMDRRDYGVAIERFERVRSRFPHSPYAALAELRIADALFAQDRYLEAADAYRMFARLRSAHPKAHYAAFREGLALVRQSPSTFFFMPPAHEKDLTHVYEVADILIRFLNEFPESEYSDEARELLDESRARLARHEMYVAEFYGKRERWQAVVFRLETLLETYPGLGFDDEARIFLAKAYLSLPEPDYDAASYVLEIIRATEGVDENILSRARLMKEKIIEAGDSYPEE